MNEFTLYLIGYGMYAVCGIVAFLVLKSIFNKAFESYHSRWNILLDSFSFSTQEFYSLLKYDLKSQGIKALEITMVSLKEGNAFSSKRLYLRVSWKEYQYDICAAPFGKKGFFISWWLLYKTSIGQIIISKIPFIGKWLERKLFPITFYKVDTASMFMTYAQASVLRVIDTISKEHGVRVLTEAERRPVLQDIFKR
jgi:hypothetical protein